MALDYGGPSYILACSKATPQDKVSKIVFVSEGVNMPSYHVVLALFSTELTGDLYGYWGLAGLSLTLSGLMVVPAFPQACERNISSKTRTLNLRRIFNCHG